ncbi:MAG: glycosyltransferase family 39 protein [Gemmatimonadota bacterium]|nr:glycosyltransferase family 39 protein [Gemmatimonadota bacterium]
MLIALAAILAVIAVALPPGPTAVALVGVDALEVGTVTFGLWLWKALLLAHAALLWAVARKGSPGRGPSGPSGLEPHGAIDAAGDEAGWLTRDRALIAVASIMVIALVLRIVALGEPLWFDEVKMDARYMGEPLSWILATYDDQNQHILYSLLAKLSIGVFGDTPTGLRLPAALFGVASLAAVYAFGTRVADRREALLATAFLAVSYHHVWFSQNARGYTGLLLWTLVSSALFVDLLRNRESPRWGLAAAYGATIALALYTHLTAAVLPAAHGLLALWARFGPGIDADERPAAFPLFAGLTLAGTLSLQLYAPVLPQVGVVLLEPSLSGVEIAWKNPLWLATETFATLSSGIPGGALVLVPAGAVGLYGLWSSWKSDPAATLTMVLPVLLTAAAIIGLGHNLWPRFFFFGAGFAVLIGLRGLFSLAGLAGERGPALATTLCLLAIVASLTTVPSAWGPKQDFLAAEAFVDEQAAAGDAIAIVDMTLLVYDEWRGRDFIQLMTLDDLVAAETEYDRVWVLTSFPTRLEVLEPEIWNRLESGYREAARFWGTVGGGEIRVMVSQ